MEAYVTAEAALLPIIPVLETIVALLRHSFRLLQQRVRQFQERCLLGV